MFGLSFGGPKQIPGCLHTTSWTRGQRQRVRQGKKMQIYSTSLTWTNSRDLFLNQGTVHEFSEVLPISSLFLLVLINSLVTNSTGENKSQPASLKGIVNISPPAFLYSSTLSISNRYNDEQLLKDVYG